MPTELQKTIPFTRGLGYVSHVLAEYKDLLNFFGYLEYKEKEYAMRRVEFRPSHPKKYGGVYLDI